MEGGGEEPRCMEERREGEGRKGAQEVALSLSPVSFGMMFLIYFSRLPQQRDKIHKKKRCGWHNQSRRMVSGIILSDWYFCGDSTGDCTKQP